MVRGTRVWKVDDIRRNVYINVGKIFNPKLEFSAPPASTRFPLNAFLFVGNNFNNENSSAELKRSWQNSSRTARVPKKVSLKNGKYLFLIHKNKGLHDSRFNWNQPWDRNFVYSKVSAHVISGARENKQNIYFFLEIQVLFSETQPNSLRCSWIWNSSSLLKPNKTSSICDCKTCNECFITIRQLVRLTDD